MTRYPGAHRLADLVLTATYCEDMRHPVVRDGNRIAWVVACMLLAELALTGQIQVSRDGRLAPASRTPIADVAAGPVLRALQLEPEPCSCSEFLQYLVLHDRVTGWVWQRLVQQDIAIDKKPTTLSRLLHRPTQYEVANVRATASARLYLLKAVTDDEPVSPDAVTLWHGLRELNLHDRVLDMAPRHVVDRLNAAPLPAETASLCRSLTAGLAHLAIQL